MEPNFVLDPELLDNGADFASPFFAGLRERRSTRPLKLDGRSKDYLFPTLYADVGCAQAIFPCSFDAARDLLREALGPEALPLRLIGGKSLVALSCYEYRRVRGLRPYNEIAVALPVRLDGRSGPPLLGAFLPGPESGYHILSMPVTSEENRMRGAHFWNLPKITRRIDIEVDDGICSVASYDGDGTTLDISLAVPLSGKERRISSRSFLATRMEAGLARSPTAFDGRFSVNLHPGALLGKGGKPVLVLGRGAASDALRRLGAASAPLQTRYATSMESWFDLPEGEAVNED